MQRLHGIIQRMEEKSDELNSPSEQAPTQEVTYMNIIKYVGVYLLVGFIIHMGWTFIFECWIRKKVGSENFSEAVSYYLGLKMRLYDKYAGLKEAKAFMERMLESSAASILLWVAFTMVIWPVAFFEDCAVYNDMVNYVHDVTKESSES